MGIYEAFILLFGAFSGYNFESGCEKLRTNYIKLLFFRGERVSSFKCKIMLATKNAIYHINTAIIDR